MVVDDYGSGDMPCPLCRSDVLPDWLNELVLKAEPAVEPMTATAFLSWLSMNYPQNGPEAGTWR
jgi:hypothetical protein